MAPQTKSRFLQCKIENCYMDKVVISAIQSDLTPIYGEIFKNQLQANFLEVEVLNEDDDNSLIVWPVSYCCANDACGSGEIWVSKKFLI